MYATLDGNKWWCITLMKQYHNKSTKLSGFCHFGLVFYMVLWQSPDNPIMSGFHVSVRLQVCSSLVSCWRVVFGSQHSCLEFRFRVGVRTLALRSLSSFRKTSRKNSPLWELLPSNLSWRPIGSRQSKWLANCRKTCKYDEFERPYKCGAHDNYVRIFFFTLLNLGYGLNYYSSQLRFAHSRAGLMAAPLQRSGEYDIFLKIVRLPSDQQWTFRTQVMSSCRLNVRIPLTRQTCRTGHQPDFSRPPSMEVRRA